MSKDSRDRERTIADVFFEAFTGHGPVLVAGDHLGFAAQRLAAAGHEVCSWSRWSGRAAPGTIWPAGGPYPSGALRIPKEKPALDLAVHAVAAHLEVGATMWVYGANDEGIRSTAKRLHPLFEEVLSVRTKRHCRVLRARRAPGQSAVSPLSAWRIDGQIGLDGVEVPWVSYPGIFARGALDPGTEALLTTIGAPPERARILDFACGTGVIAATLARRTPNVELVLTDADAIAVESARQNVPTGTVYLGDAWAGVPPGPYDWIVSNPPLHAGKLEDHRVLEALVDEAPQRLASGGALWLVIQRRVAVEPLLRQRFQRVEVAHDTARFRVWCAR
jgi:16S rRNA (guanine1207-N2)-methyltransferase